MTGKSLEHIKQILFHIFLLNDIIYEKVNYHKLSERFAF